VFPLLAANPQARGDACDCAPRAVALVRARARAAAGRATAFVADVTVPGALAGAVPAGGVDVCTLVFVLSAISPAKMPQARRTPRGGGRVRAHVCAACVPLQAAAAGGGRIVSKRTCHMWHAMERCSRGLPALCWERSSGSQVRRIACRRKTRGAWLGPCQSATPQHARPALRFSGMTRQVQAQRIRGARLNAVARPAARSLRPVKVWRQGRCRLLCAPPQALRNIAATLRPGRGRVLVRDYARGDLAQARRPSPRHPALYRAKRFCMSLIEGRIMLLLRAQPLRWYCAADLMRGAPPHPALNRVLDMITPSTATQHSDMLGREQSPAHLRA